MGGLFVLIGRKTEILSGASTRLEKLETALASKIAKDDCANCAATIREHSADLKRLEGDLSDRVTWESCAAQQQKETDARLRDQEGLRREFLGAVSRIEALVEAQEKRRADARTENSARFQKLVDDWDRWKIDVGRTLGGVSQFIATHGRDQGNVFNNQSDHGTIAAIVAVAVREALKSEKK